MAPALKLLFLILEMSNSVLSHFIVHAAVDKLIPHDSEHGMLCQETSLAFLSFPFAVNILLFRSDMAFLS
jgi:hypothetical protein